MCHWASDFPQFQNEASPAFVFLFFSTVFDLLIKINARIANPTLYSKQLIKIKEIMKLSWSKTSSTVDYNATLYIMFLLLLRFLHLLLFIYIYIYIYIHSGCRKTWATRDLILTLRASREILYKELI